MVADNALDYLGNLSRKWGYLEDLQSSKISLGLVRGIGLVYAVDQDDWPWKNLPEANKLGTLSDGLKDQESLFGTCAGFGGLEFRLLRRVLESGQLDVVLDAGANYGREAIRYSLFLKSLRGEGARPIPIVAFEPGEVRKVAMLNIDLHGCDDIVLLPHAVYDRRGFVEFGFPASGSLGGSATNIGAEWIRSIVPTIALGLLLNEIGAHGTVFAKFDLQGGEYHALKGFHGQCDEVRLCGVLEFMPSMLRKHTSVEGFLTELLDRYHLIDLGPERTLRAPVEPDMVKEVIARHGSVGLGFTDFLFWDKRLPITAGDIL